MRTSRKCDGPRAPQQRHKKGRALPDDRSPIFRNLSFQSWVFCRSQFCHQWPVHLGLCFLGRSEEPWLFQRTGPLLDGTGPVDSYLEAGAFPLTFERRPWKLIVSLVSLAFNCCLITWFPFLISLLMCSVWWEKKDSLWTAEEIPWETHHPLQRPPGIPLLSEVHKRRGSQKGN